MRILVMVLGVLIGGGLVGQVSYHCGSIVSQKGSAQKIDNLCSIVLSEYGPSCQNSDSNIPSTCYDKVRLPVRLIKITSGGVSVWTNSEIISEYNQAAQIIEEALNVELFRFEDDITVWESPSLYSPILPGAACQSSDDEMAIETYISNNSTLDRSPINIFFSKDLFSTALNNDGSNRELGGVASFPGDGNYIVLPDAFNFVGLGSDEGIILAHEFGHYFGLLHTFQEGAGPNIFTDAVGFNTCNLGDKIFDTPGTGSISNFTNCGTTSFSSCNLSVDGANECGISEDEGQLLIDNYMSYSGNCRKSFTPFQKRKMWDVVHNGCRTDLCVRPRQPSVFTFPLSTTVVFGESISFSATVDAETGSNTGNCVEWSYENGSQTIRPADKSNSITLTTGPGGNIPNEGTYQICATDVPVYNSGCESLPNCITIQVVNDNPSCSIAQNCLQAQAICGDADSYGVIVSFDGDPSVDYTINAFLQDGSLFGSITNAIPNSSNLPINGIPIGQTVTLTAEETGVASCFDQQVVSFFPPFNPTTSNTACGSNLFTVNYTLGEGGGLPEYLVSDDQGNSELLAVGDVFNEAYTSGTSVTLTIQDPNSPDCAQVSQVLTLDCGNPPEDECANLVITSVGTPNCEAETIAVTISGDPTTTYQIGEILNEVANAAPVNALGGSTVNVPYNIDGTGLTSVAVLTMSGEECARQTSISLSSCDPPTDPGEYCFYWPFEDGIFTSSPWQIVDGSPFHVDGDQFAQDWNLNTGGNTDCAEPLYAPIDAQILYAGNTGSGFGNQIIFQTIYPGVAVRYAHLQDLYVATGETVTAGRLVGTVGSTGGDFFCHLHAVFYQGLDAGAIGTLSTGGFLSAAYAADYDFNCADEIVVNSFSTPGQCVGPSESMDITFSEFGTSQRVVVQYCDSGNNCTPFVGGNAFVLDNSLNQDSWILNTTSPSVPGIYTVNIYDVDNLGLSVFSSNSFEVSDACNISTANCIPPPAFTANSNEDGTSVDLAWSAVNGATGYVIESKLSSSSSWSRFPDLVQVTSFTANASPCVGYDIRVATVCEDGSETDFTSVSFVTNGCDGTDGVGGGTGGEFVGDCPGDNDDDEDPVFINCPPQNYTFDITSADECEAYVNWSVPVAIDNCNVSIQQTSGPAPGTTQPAGVYSVSYLAEDNNGNTETCSFSVTVEDSQQLQFTNCPTEALTVGINNAESCQAYLNWSIPVATDNCEVTVMQTNGPEVGSLQDVGVYNIVYQATNNGTGAALETATCSFFIQVEDPQTLAFTNCPTETLVFGTNADLCSVTTNWSIPVATDNCEVTVSHVSGPRPGDVLAPGTYEVVYEATNNGVGDALETATCSFFVEVVETQNPELNCPQDVFVESDPGVCEAAVENIQLEFAFDNCPYTVTWASSPTDVTGTGTSTSDNASGAIFPVGTTTVTYTIMENGDNGNGIAVATCDLIVEVTDTEAPEITCPPSVVIGTDDDGQGNYDCATDYTWTHPTPTDNCAVTVYELTYTNPDGSVEGPLNWGADAGAMTGRNFALGVTSILYHVEDAEGNITECTWTVEVIDDEDPMIFCEENLATNELTFLGGLEILPRDTVAAVITVPVSATISDVNITALAGTHPDMGELKVTLTSPAGTTITLFDGLCAGTTNFETALDDDAASSINTAPCNSLGGGGIFAPADALSVFNGENSQGDWVLTFISQLEGACGELEAWDLEIIGNDNTVPPANRLQLVADAGTCSYFLEGTDFDPRFIDNCEGSFITHDYLSGPFDTTLMGSVFPIGETEILWTVTDAAGNIATCPMIIEVLDNEAPIFTNCDRPDIIANPAPGVCDAFVNFSLPVATDNCGDEAVTINQTDLTGLTTGMRFPVGTTILMYEAVDPAGNKSDCEFRVIVNDNQDVVMTAASCPDDQETTTDAGDCEAVVNGLAPQFDDNCGDNLSYSYKILDEDGNEIANGFTDASGEAFPLGVNTVFYRAQDQPILLITEITHEIQETLGGNDVIPAYIGLRGLPDGDYLELTNFGPARKNIGGLDIERVTATGIDHFRVPALEILEPGETFVLQFGNDDASPANHYYAIECATDLTSTDGAAYIISHSGRVLDVAAINGFDPVGQGSAATVAAADWSGSIFDGLAGIRRASVYDDNDANDFVAATVCGEITIGQYNPDFDAAPNNGSLTANQARKPNKEECSFTVTVTDEETAQCGSYQPYDDYEFGQATTIAAGDCFEATLNVTDAYQLADVNTTLVGTAGNFVNLRITLISPEGDEVILASNECSGSPGFDLILDSDSITRPFIYDACSSINSALHLRPRQDLNLFNTRPSAGVWTLRIAHDATVDAEDVMLESWTLSLSELIAYAQEDETVENDFRECGAEFTWLHTGIWDNCPGGSVEVTYLFKDTIQDSYPITRDRFGRDTTRFFDVGITTVRYTLTDANGNVSSCSFDLTVLDTEPPVLVCPADTTLFLAGGECDIVYIPTDWFTEDNCGVVDTTTSPDWNLPLPIGINPVNLTVVDSSGNETVCTYVVTVVEYDPPNPQMACVGDINVSLDNDCSVDILPEMLLAGNEYYCFDNYEVTLLQRNEEGEFDTLSVPTVGTDQIGDTLIYNVYDPRNDDLCWGYLRVGFFEAPEFVCPVDVSIPCSGSFDPELNGEPVLLSCALAGATVSYADTLEQFGPCDGPRAVLHRTWLVQDAYGNSASCVQDITLEAFNPQDIVFPSDLDGTAAPALSCAAVANDPTLTEPENTGFPTVPGGGNVFGTNFCSASFLFTDEVFDICAGSYQIVRTWKVLNTCGAVEAGVTLFTATQVIRVLDQDRPALVCPEDEEISTGGLGCFGEYAVPVPVVEESCSGWTYEVTTSGGTLSLILDRYYLTDLEEGTYTIRYYVEDECGGFSECIYSINVTDQVAASASCEDQINVSLDVYGTATITPEDIDGGSTDFCSAVDLAVRKEVLVDPVSCSAVTSGFTTWGESVTVNCCEINDLVKVELQVTDENGNISTCWTNVLVEDKIAPVCLAPGEVTVTCFDLRGEIPDDLEDAMAENPEGTASLLDAVFGFAGTTDNCGPVTLTQSVTDNRNSCGIGAIRRRFTATDAQGLSPAAACLQTINVVQVHDYIIELPADRENDACEEPDYEGIGFTGIACDLLTVNTTIDTLSADAEECYKLRITYEAINWCEHGATAELYDIPRDADRDGSHEEVTYLHVTPGPDLNVITDDIALLSSSPVLTPGNVIGFLDRQDAGASGYPAALTGFTSGADQSEPYATDRARGGFRYVQYIRVYDATAPVVEAASPLECFPGTETGCEATVSMDFTAYDVCSFAEPAVELDAFYDPVQGFVTTQLLTDSEVVANGDSTFTITKNNVPAGNHAFRIRASDGCGNNNLLIVPFCVEPAIAPSPICIQTLTVTLMPDENGAVALLWGSDLIASPITDCFGNEVTDYSLYLESVAGESGFVPAAGVLSTEFNCADANNNVLVRLYAFDQTGANDYCSAVVEVQLTNDNLCAEDPEMATVAGTIHSMLDEPLEGVIVTIEGAAISEEVLTEGEGTYSFTGLLRGEDYTVSPAHFHDYLNGVRTSDIVEITRHILGVQPLNSPFQRLAADVNGDAAIDVGDIIVIRSLILGLVDAYPNNMPSWSFIPTGYEFPEPGNPWFEVFPQVINFNDLSQSMLLADFVAIKLGDVNNSAANPAGRSVPPVPGKALELEMPIRELVPGKLINVPVKSSQLNTFAGFQGTLTLSHRLAKLVAVQPSYIDQGHYVADIINNEVRISWNLSNGISPPAPEDVLFTLQIEARSVAEEDAVTTVDALSFGGELTISEAYQLDDEPARVDLVFVEGVVSDGYRLLPNEPNPFKGQTTIRFELPRAEDQVTITITDATGRVVREVRQPATKGRNELVIKSSELGASGVFFYRVGAGEWMASRRMVVLE